MPSSELTDTELQALAAEPLRPAEVQFPSMSEVVTPAAVPTFERDAYTLLTAPLLQHSNPVPDASFRPEAFWRVSGGSATGQIPADPDSAFVWTPVDRVLSAKASPASLPLLTAPIPWTQTPPDKDQLVASGPGATDTDIAPLARDTVKPRTREETVETAAIDASSTSTASAGAPLLRVVLHYAGDRSQERARQIAENVEDAIGVEVELRVVDIELSESRVRYFHEEDLAVAAFLAALGGELAVQDFTTFRPQPESRLIEMWVSS